MKKGIRIALNALIVLFVAGVWAAMTLRPGGTFARTMDTLRYFTWLSNTLAGLAAVFWLVCLGWKKGRGPAEICKYMTATGVGLTFLTVICFLGPVFGFRGMYTESGLWFHLIVPLIAMAECVFFSETRMGPRENALAVLPVVGYGIYYLANIAVNGLRSGRRSNDLYGFFTWGTVTGALILAALVGVSFLIGLALRKANAKAPVRGGKP